MVTEVFEELQSRRPIVIDPMLVRAAQLADIHLLNETKERENDLEDLDLSSLYKWINKHKRNIHLGSRAR